MIVSHKHKLVFITTPKSGSHTGFKLMQDYFNSEPTNFNHAKINRFPEYECFTFVRNPYERFCALYHACVVNHFKPWVPGHARKTKLDYAIWYAKMKTSKNYVRPDLTSPQSVWHKGTNVKTYIQIERAQEFFDENYPQLGIVMPHELRREHLTWDEVKSDNLLHYVNIWAGDDFRLYGYDKQ